MSAVVEYAIVAAALLASVGYALLSLGPRAWRRGVLSWMALWAARAPGLTGWAKRLEAAAGRSAACGGCDGCADEKAAAAPAHPEIRIPIGHIGRRH